MSTPSTAAAHDAHHADHEHAAGHGHHGGHGHRAGYDFAHPFPVWGLLAVFFTLVFLTILTVAQAHFSLGSWEIVVSLFIASVKAALVVFFFMHLAFDKSYNAIIFIGSLLFVSLFLGATLMDSQTTRDLIIMNTGDDQAIAAP